MKNENTTAAERTIENFNVQRLKWRCFVPVFHLLGTASWATVALCKAVVASETETTDKKREQRKLKLETMRCSVLFLGGNPFNILRRYALFPFV